jgi:2-polyprenyl-3-methyl-5-hydroxy-6-metoxy-1,4-benzoquinol methylase
VSKRPSQQKDKRQARETNQAVLEKAMLRRLPRRLGATGRLFIPAVPALSDHFTEHLHELFATLGRVFTPDETAQLRGILQAKLGEAFALSPYSLVLVEYMTEDPPATGLGYNVSVAPSSVEREYETWVAQRTPPYFGVHPDAKILECARSLGAPADVPVLDLGAGTGRNALPLARAGHPTDALELAPALANILRTEAEKEQLALRVLEANALARDLALPERHYRLICMAEVIASHIRSVEEIRVLFTTAARLLAKDGLLVFNAFIAHAGYRPDVLARELSQVCWSNLFTQADIAAAMDGVPFEFVSEESTHDFEHERQPAEAWPPTGWFVEWARGLNVFDLPGGRAPMDLRWFVYRRL